MRTFLPDRTGRTILELGTGWYPVVPILFYLTSADRVITIDIQKWMTRKSQQETLVKFIEWKMAGRLDDLLPFIDEARWERVSGIVENPSAYSMEQINELTGIMPLIQDARKIFLKSGSVDFICSNNTFEHIPPGVLRDILREFSRLLVPGGAMSHFIDLTDHFAHMDRQITIYNFLKYSNKLWAILDNRIQPQNRMRFRDYTEMYRDLGIPVTDQKLFPGHLLDLKRIRVHPEFRDYTPEELIISHAYVITALP
jgi:hypothetical protein